MVRRFRGFALSALTAALVAVGWGPLAPSARAAEGPSSEADQLFQIGRRAAQLGDWETACAAFASSLRVEAAAGTFINLGDCEERRGNYADAIVNFRAALQMLTPSDDRVAAVRDRARVLEGRVPHLTLLIAKSSAPGTTVSLDGALVDRERLGTRLSVNPGRHELVGTAVGHRGTRVTVTLAAGEHRVVELSAGEPIDDASEVPTRGAAQTNASPAMGSHIPWAGLAIASAAAGVASIWVGSAFGVAAIERENQRRALCTEDNRCTEPGLAAASSGKNFADASTVLFVVGGALLAGGAALWFLPSKGGARAQATVAPIAGGAAAVWRGEF